MLFAPELFEMILSYLKPKDPDPRNCLDTTRELKSILRILGLKTGGNKLDLMKRLLKAGVWARRPCWDTVASGMAWGLKGACKRPLLTFFDCMHDEDKLVATSISMVTRADALAETLLGPRPASQEQWEDYRRHVGASLDAHHAMRAKQMRYANQCRKESLDRVWADESETEMETDSDDEGALFTVAELQVESGIEALEIHTILYAREQIERDLLSIEERLMRTAILS